MPWRKALYRKWVAARHRLFGIPATGRVNFGDLRRVDPFGRHFGTDRGQAIDRYYIEEFLQSRSADICGRVLEAGDDAYTRRFGAHRVTCVDVISIDDRSPQATIVADLADAPHIPDDTFDCIVLTQVLHLIYEPRSAIRTLHRILKPGGVLLMTTPGLSQVPQGTVWAHTWYWAYTELAALRMLEEAFGKGRVAVDSTGNVLAATAMLYGLAAGDLASHELRAHDPDYPVIITARAQKRHAGD